MAIEKCINEYEVSDVIFEEGSVGRELFVVLEGKIDIVKQTSAGRTHIRITQIDAERDSRL